MTTPSPALGNRTPEQLKVAELREELKKRGIQIKGLKKDLVDRLEEVLKQEELEQQKALATEVEEAIPSPEADQPDPVTSVTKRDSEGDAKEEVPKDEPILASEGTEITVSVVEESKPQEGDTVPEASAEIVTAATSVEETTVTTVIDNVGEELPAVESVKIVDDQATITTAVPALEDLVADLEQNFKTIVEEEPQVQQVEEEPQAQQVEEETQAQQVEEEPQAQEVEEEPQAQQVEKEPQAQQVEEEPQAQQVEKEPQAQQVEEEPQAQQVEKEPQVQQVEKEPQTQQVEKEPQVQQVEKEPQTQQVEKEPQVQQVEKEPQTQQVEEEPQVQQVEEEPQAQKAEDEPQVQQVEETGTMEGQALTEKSSDIAPAVGKAMDENMPVVEDEVISTTFERTVEEQDVSAVPVDQNIATMEVEQTVSTSTRVETEIMEPSASEVVTMEETTTTVMTLETTTIVADGEGLVIDAGAVGVLEGRSDEKTDEAPKEDVTEVVIIAESLKDEMTMDVDGGSQKESNGDDPKEQTAMDVDADTQKGSKRKDAVDGEFATLEPTKRRRWNSAKGEEGSKTLGKDVQPLELQEPMPSANAPVPPAKVLTPKSAPAEKVAVTRTAPTRTEAPAVNGEGQKTRLVPPSVKPPTTSLKIDKFLRPFTFKAVTELLAQTGTVQDVWMDQIKTHCFVTYSSVEQASATRNAVYNLQWPPQGGRLLTAEFVDPSEVKLRSDGDKAVATAGPAAIAAPSANAITPRGTVSANSKPSKDGVTVAASGQPSTPAAGLLPPPPLVSFSPRDRPKLEVESTPTLDDLFRKTRSKPHIYYLPLTAQEVADKVAARNRGAATKPGVKA